MPATPLRSLARLLTSVVLVVSAAVTALAAAGASASASTPTASAPTHARTAAADRSVHTATRMLARVARAKRIAMAQRGDPYRYGAAGPNAFDCSGLVFFATHRAGFRRVPRSSGAQAASMHRVAKRRMRPGDFMYFYGSGGVYHAAIFLGWRHGHAMMLHSPRPGGRVSIARTWTNAWFGRTLR